MEEVFFRWKCYSILWLRLIDQFLFFYPIWKEIKSRLPFFPLYNKRKSKSSIHAVACKDNVGSGIVKRFFDTQFPCLFSAELKLSSTHLQIMFFFCFFFCCAEVNLFAQLTDVDPFFIGVLVLIVWKLEGVWSFGFCSN